MTTSAVVLTIVSGANAQTPLKNLRRLAGERAEKTSTGVTLQPFTMDEPVSPPASALHSSSRVLKAVAAEPMRLAYYAPRAQAVELPKPASDYNNEEMERAETVIETRYNGPTVAGNRAVLRNGIAYAPSRAPANVKNAIWAVNSLRRKPYVWGGGHRSFYDYGYDCSGSVSYALHYAGLLAAPIPSSDFTRYGERGRGRWITVYARHGHTFAVIAGLRLDTTDLRSGGDVGPRWYADGRDARGFDTRHPIGM
jgi:cell wall-associated NlpC family hydrolase